MPRAACAAILLVVLAAPARGLEPADAGQVFYRRYCGACHGTDAKGNGPVAPALGEKPSDLTAIARRNGGDFPFLAVVAAIDGTREVRAYGVSEMPVWGEVFARSPGSAAERQAEARGKIVLVTEYLRSIQAR
jgi:mono/diheme cytochrome c family protein